jgi:N-methylhydantoinase A
VFDPAAGAPAGGSVRLDTPIYARDLLQPGDCLVGPAIVEEFGSTTVVPPGLVAEVDEFLNLLLKRP